MELYQLIDNALCEHAGERTIIDDFFRALVCQHFNDYDPYIMLYYGEEGVFARIKAEGKTVIPKELRKKEVQLWYDPDFERAAAKALDPQFWDPQPAPEEHEPIIKAARFAMMDIAGDYMSIHPRVSEEAFPRFCQMRAFERAVYNGDVSDQDTIQRLKDAAYLCDY